VTLLGRDAQVDETAEPCWNSASDRSHPRNRPSRFVAAELMDIGGVRRLADESGEVDV
jgi:hypothetical protein